MNELLELEKQFDMLVGMEDMDLSVVHEAYNTLSKKGMCREIYNALTEQGIELKGVNPRRLTALPSRVGQEEAMVAMEGVGAIIAGVAIAGFAAILASWLLILHKVRKAFSSSITIGSSTNVSRETIDKELKKVRERVSKQIKDVDKSSYDIGKQVNSKIKTVKPDEIEDAVFTEIDSISKDKDKGKAAVAKKIKSVSTSGTYSTKEKEWRAVLCKTLTPSGKLLTMGSLLNYYGRRSDIKNPKDEQLWKKLANSKVSDLKISHCITTGIPSDFDNVVMLEHRKMWDSLNKIFEAVAVGCAAVSEYVSEASKVASASELKEMTLSEDKVGRLESYQVKAVEKIMQTLPWPSMQDSMFNDIPPANSNNYEVVDMAFVPALESLEADEDRIDKLAHSVAANSELESKIKIPEFDPDVLNYAKTLSKMFTSLKESYMTAVKINARAYSLLQRFLAFNNRFAVATVGTEDFSEGELIAFEEFVDAHADGSISAMAIAAKRVADHGMSENDFETLRPIHQVEGPMTEDNARVAMEALDVSVGLNVLKVAGAVGAIALVLVAIVKAVKYLASRKDSHKSVGVVVQAASKEIDVRAMKLEKVEKLSGEDVPTTPDPETISPKAADLVKKHEVAVKEKRVAEVTELDLNMVKIYTSNLAHALSKHKRDVKLTPPRLKAYANRYGFGNATLPTFDVEARSLSVVLDWLSKQENFEPYVASVIRAPYMKYNFRSLTKALQTMKLETCGVSNMIGVLSGKISASARFFCYDKKMAKSLEVYIHTAHVLLADFDKKVVPNAKDDRRLASELDHIEDKLDVLERNGTISAVNNWFDKLCTADSDQPLLQYVARVVDGDLFSQPKQDYTKVNYFDDYVNSRVYDAMNMMFESASRFKEDAFAKFSDSLAPEDKALMMRFKTFYVKAAIIVKRLESESATLAKEYLEVNTMIKRKSR